MLEKFPQGNGIVMFGIVGTVEERYRAFFRGLNDGRQTLHLMLQLREISPAEFIPAIGLMMEPLAKVRAWRHVS